MKAKNLNIVSMKSNKFQSRNLIKNAYEEWIHGILFSYWMENASASYVRFDEYVKTCGFFFTMTFSTSVVFKEKLRLGILNDDFSVELDTFQFLYASIAEGLFGKKWTKRKFEPKLPQAIVCVDFEGARLGREIPASPKNVHIHAIWLIHPEEIEKFQKLITGLRFRFRVLNSIHADTAKWEPYLIDKAQTGRLGSYVTKSFIKSEKKPLGGELLRVYPNSNNGGKPYRALYSYRRADRMLAKMRSAVAKQCWQQPISVGEGYCS